MCQATSSGAIRSRGSDPGPDTDTLRDMAVVVVCRGKTCRRSEGHDELRRELEDVAEVVTSSCLDICKGPVVVIEPTGEHPAVLQKVRSPKARRDVRAVVETGAGLSPRLERRQVAKKKARKALATAIAAVGRKR